MSERPLTAPQRDMLERIAQSTYGKHYVSPKGLRTADALIRRGLLRDIGQGWCGITSAGRAVLAERGLL